MNCFLHKNFFIPVNFKVNVNDYVVCGLTKLREVGIDFLTVKKSY